MSKLEEFKDFVRQNPNLIKYIQNNEMTWQKFYEMYDIYGNSDEVWNEYLTIPSKSKASLTDLLSFFKGVDLDSVQEGVENIQRVVEMLGDISHTSTKPEYKPRPLYKHFDD